MMRDRNAEEQWERGFIVNDIGQRAFSLDPEAWDDSAILNIFDEAIRSHKTKKATVKGKKNLQPKDTPSVDVQDDDSRPSNTGSREAPSQYDERLSGVGVEESEDAGDSQPRKEAKSAYSRVQQMPDVPHPGHPRRPNLVPPPQLPTFHGPGPSTFNSDSHFSESSIPYYNTHAYNNEHQPHHDEKLETDMEEAFNSMLMAWYQSGYATGRYQALREVSDRRRGHAQSPASASAQSYYDYTPSSSQQEQQYSSCGNYPAAAEQPPHYYPEATSADVGASADRVRESVVHFADSLEGVSMHNPTPNQRLAQPNNVRPTSKNAVPATTAHTEPHDIESATRSGLNQDSR